jgi:hypothetical protein
MRQETSTSIFEPGLQIGRRTHVYHERLGAARWQPTSRIDQEKRQQAPDKQQEHQTAEDSGQHLSSHRPLGYPEPSSAWFPAIGLQPTAWVFLAVKPYTYLSRFELEGQVGPAVGNAAPRLGQTWD